MAYIKDRSTQGTLVYSYLYGRIDINSGTRRRHEGAPPLVGESDLKPASELKP